jgi:hypothetical protein
MRESTPLQALAATTASTAHQQASKTTSSNPRSRRRPSRGGSRTRPAMNARPAGSAADARLPSISRTCESITMLSATTCASGSARAPVGVRGCCSLRFAQISRHTSTGAQQLTLSPVSKSITSPTCTATHGNMVVGRRIIAHGAMARAAASQESRVAREAHTNSSGCRC